MWRDHNPDWNRDFLSEAKFSETKTKTFFSRPDFRYRDQIFQNKYRNLFSETIFFETEAETQKKKLFIPETDTEYLYTLGRTGTLIFFGQVGYQDYVRPWEIFFCV